MEWPKSTLKNIAFKAVKLAMYSGLAYCGSGAAGVKAAAAALALKEGLNAASQEEDKAR